jgi:hypothetical protein
MRLLNDKRGQVRIIEAFFAAMLLLSVLAMLPNIPSARNDSTQTLSSTAYNTLLSLDQEGQIGSMIKNRDWNGLQVLIQSALPTAAWFNLTVYDANMNTVNDKPISNGSPVSDSIVAVDYSCVGLSSDFAVYLVRLQVAGVD